MKKITKYKTQILDSSITQVQDVGIILATYKWCLLARSAYVHNAQT